MPRLENPNWVEFRLELCPYLQKFHEEKKGCKFLRVEGRSEVGQYILQHAKVPHGSWKPRRVPAAKKFILKIPSHYFTDQGKGQYLSDENLKFIQTWFEVGFWKALYEYVSNRRLLYGEKELVSIRRFRELFSISEDDYKEESMYKRFRRIKEKRTARVSIGLD